MDPLVHHLPTRSTFPFDQLPTDIQSRILAFLPITTLVVCKAVSRSWRSLIRSPAFAAAHTHLRTRRHHDPIFLLFSGSAYLPSRDRWIPFALHASRVLATAASLLLLAGHRNQIAVFNPFSGLFSILPYLDPKRHQFTFIENTPSRYRILALRSTSTVHSFIYDSRYGKWEPSGEYAHGPVTLIDTVCMDGIIYCLIWSTNDLLVFDPDDGWWSRFSLAMPNYIHGVTTLAFTHIVGYGGNLYLVAGLKWKMWVMGIVMWVMDLEREEWRRFGCMPPELFSEFRGGRGGGLRSFEMVDRLGVICFCNCEGERILMFDLEERRWWWPRANDVGKTWIGCVVEPHIDLLK